MEEAGFSVNQDHILWQNFKSGDQEAFNKIYENFYPLLLDYGLKIKRDKEFVKDCIQEIFCNIYSHAKTLGNTDNILFYLIASLRRKIFRKIRYDKTYRWEESFFTGMPALIEDSLEQHVMDKERHIARKNLLKSLIDQLTPRQKEALLMKFYLSLDYPDIAQLMGLNVQSVRNLVHRAIKTLREEIKNHVI
jgi:RNA polymerase sigma factor (sigma-70 family)